MPIYEYRCEACGAEFELLVLGRSGDAEPGGEAVACPTCPSGAVARKPSRFGFAAGGAGRTHRPWPGLGAGGPAAGAGAASSLPVASAGGCCGGSCGCRPSR